MGWLQDFFTSPKERTGKEMYKKSIGDYDTVLNEIGGMKSSVDGINGIKDVRSTFGLPGFDRKAYNSQVESSFAPSRGALATRFAKMRKNYGNTMSGSDASPDASLEMLSGDEAGAFGSLESAVGGAKLAGFDKETEDNRYVANMLERIFGNKDAFATNKTGLKLNGLNARSGAQAGYLDSMSEDSTFDDILGVANTAANVYGAFMPKVPKVKK